jgi:hypothetical protein
MNAMWMWIIFVIVVVRGSKGQGGRRELIVALAKSLVFGIID